MTKILIFLLSILGLSTQAAQIPLTPRFSNYHVKDFNAGNQNWSMTEDNEGRLYFANNKGLLEFDGNKWQLYSLPNQEIIRSVYYSKDERIYVGSFEELGYFF